MRISTASGILGANRPAAGTKQEKRCVKSCLAAIVAVLAVGSAQAAELSPTDIVNRRLAAAARTDIEAIMADYADDAAMIQSGKAVEGEAAIRALFEGFFARRAPGAPSGMQVTRVWQDGHVGFASWTRGPVNGTDEFLVRDGKILVQAVFLSGAPPAPAKSSRLTAPAR